MFDRVSSAGHDETQQRASFQFASLLPSASAAEQGEHFFLKHIVLKESETRSKRWKLRRSLAQHAAFTSFARGPRAGGHRR